METKSKEPNPYGTSSSTDFERDTQVYRPTPSPYIAHDEQKEISSKRKQKRPIEGKGHPTPKITIQKPSTQDVNKSTATHLNKGEKHNESYSCSSEEENKGLHLSIKDEDKQSDDDSSLVRSDCLHEDDLVHLAEQVKVQEEQNVSIQDFAPKTVDEADQIGALDDFLLDNEGDDYVPPTIELLSRKETAQIKRQVTDGSLMSQESAKLIRTKGSVNEKAKNMTRIQDYNKLKNEREKAQQIFRECLDVELLGKDFRTEDNSGIPEEEEENITLLRATRTQGSANLIEVVSHLKEAQLNKGKQSKSPKISTFKKKAQKKQSRQGRFCLTVDLLHVMYKIPKHLTPKTETVPVLTSKSRKHSRMSKTIEKQMSEKTQNNSRNERANLSASLNPKIHHKPNRSFNMYDPQQKRSSSRLPVKSNQNLICKTPEVQFVPKLETSKSNDTPPKNFIKNNINAVVLSPALIVKHKKKDPIIPKQTKSSNRVNMFLDFDLDKKKNQWKEVYEIPSSKTTKIFSKRAVGPNLLNQTQIANEINMTSSISPRVASHDNQVPAKKPASPSKQKNSPKSPAKDKISMSKTLYQLKPKGKKIIPVNLINQRRVKKAKLRQQIKKIDSEDSDELKRARTNSAVEDLSLLAKQVSQKQGFYEVQRSVSLLGTSSSEDNKSNSSTPKSTKKKKDKAASHFSKHLEPPSKI